MKNCLIYCRVSTEEQADKGHSLDTQENFCRDFAERNGYRMVGVFRDEGKSATNLDRPALKELLSKCTESGSLVDAVIIQETDRLARNTTDHLGVKSILRKAGVKLISVAQPMLDDSPEGMMIDTIIASVNQFQSDINSRKTKKGIQAKFDMGWWPGWAPVGYMNIAPDGNTGDGRAISIVKKDPAKWDLIREAFQMYLTGNYSTDEVVDVLHNKGLRSKHGKKVPHSTMVRILKNPFYAGVMRWNGQERIGKHEPMITQNEHRLVLEIMDAHNLHASRRRRHDFLLRGFAYCGICGHRYTGENHPAKKKSYYRCASSGIHSNRFQSVEVEKLEKEVEELFKTVQFSQEFIDSVTGRLREVYYGKRKVIGSQIQALHNQKRAVEKKRDVAEEKLFDGVILDDDFSRLRDKFARELYNIQGQIMELDHQKDLDVDVVQHILKLSNNILRAYVEAPRELKRRYLGLFWKQFIIQDRTIVKAIPTELVEHLQEEQRVQIRPVWGPDSPLIRTLEDVEYMEELKGKLRGLVVYCC